MLPLLGPGDIYVKGGRSGRKIHRGSPGCSVLGCGRWVRADVRHFALKNSDVDRAPLKNFCEHCFPAVNPAFARTPLPVPEEPANENAKEAVYDEQIAPLMRQIIAMCKAAGIPVHASFALDDDLSCTTHVAPLREDVPDDDLDAFDDWVLRYGPVARAASNQRPAPLSITTRDCDGNVIRSEVVL